MNKFIALCLTALLCLCCLASCNNTAEPKEITCEDIIRAYEDAGYFVTHGAHQDEGESSQLCYIKANATEASDRDYIYFTVCFTDYTTNIRFRRNISGIRTVGNYCR